MRRTAAAFLCTALLAAAGTASAQARTSVPTGWRHGGTCYEVFVRSFFDSNGDGIGDLNGLIQKLDYLNDGNPRTDRDLGVQCLWLMPVAESPSYHGYDVADYYKVEKDYGTNADFRRLMAEAHRRGIRVLVDMVLNHASSEHPFFQEALHDPSSAHRSWFRWSPTDLGNGPWGTPAWRKSPVRDEYYYALFWEGMPDLNYETPAVRQEALKVADFWLNEMGVDGFRLDAVPFLVEQGSMMANSPATHQVLREYGQHVRRVKPGAYTVGEVWDSTGVMLTYHPDQLDSYFTFELSDSLLSAVRSGSARGLLGGWLRVQRALPSADHYSPFLRNHDQTRTLNVLGGDRAKARVAAALLLTLPGLPFMYYGEEIGMSGDKPDERLRTPMQWGGGPHSGFTRGTPWEALQPDSATATVAAQDADPGSLLSLYRRLIRLRAANPALANGELVPLTAADDHVAAYLRRAGGRAVMVVANLGTAPVSGVAISSDARALPAGRYTPRALLGALGGAPLRVGADGRVRGYVPAPTLAPLEVRVLDLAAGAR